MTVDLDPVLRELLDDHVPAPGPDTADWADVARRAAASRRRPRLRDRRLWLGIGAVAVALGCAGAIEHHRVYQLFGADEPATGRAEEQRLLSEYRWPHGLHVDTARSRVVFQVRTPTQYDDSGPMGWTTGYGLVAPLSNGGFCLASELGPGGDYGCAGPRNHSIVNDGLAPQSWRDADGRVHLAPYVFWGVAPVGTASVELVGPDGRVRVPLSRIHLGGRRVFALHVPHRLETRGHRPTRVVARDASGRIIAHAARLTGSFTPGLMNGSAGGTGPKMAGMESGVLLRVRAGGQVHRFSADRTCVFDRYTTSQDGPIESILCYVDAFLPMVQPLADRAAVGYGKLPAGATTVSVVFAGRTEQAIVHARLYLFPVTTAELRGADLPIAVVARDANGHVVARRRLARSLFPGY
jgi:hypothetical protein